MLHGKCGEWPKLVGDGFPSPKDSNAWNIGLHAQYGWWRNWGPSICSLTFNLRGVIKKEKKRGEMVCPFASPSYIHQQGRHCSSGQWLLSNKTYFLRVSQGCETQRNGPSALDKGVNLLAQSIKCHPSSLCLDCRRAALVPGPDLAPTRRRHTHQESVSVYSLLQVYSAGSYSATSSDRAVSKHQKMSQPW